MATTLGRLQVDLIANAQAFREGLADAQKSFQSVGRSMTNVGKTLSTTVTVPIVAAGVAAFKFSNDFNAGMANVASLIPGNTTRVQELGESVKQLSIDTGQSTGTMTDGLYNVVSAFGDTADTVGILEANARAAVAGVSSVTDAINLTSAVTKSYGDTSAQAVKHAADLGIMAVRLGQTTFPELAASVGRVTPVTRELGVSQEELFATFATLTGVTGGAAEVSTQLRGALQALQTPTESVTSLFADLGVESGAALIEQLGLQGAIDALTAAANATGEPLQKYISSIEGQTLALSLSGTQSDTFTAKMDDMLNAVGATDAAFKEQTEGVNAAGFAWNQFKAAASVAMAELGDAAAPILTPVINLVRKVVEWFSALTPEVKSVIAVVGALAAAIGPALVVMGSLVTSVGAIAGVLAAASPPGMAVVATIAAISAALAAAVLIWNKWGDDIKLIVQAMINVVKPKFDAFVETIVGAAKWLHKHAIKPFIDFVVDVGHWLVETLGPIIKKAAQFTLKFMKFMSPGLALAIEGFVEFVDDTSTEMDRLREEASSEMAGLGDDMTNEARATVTGVGAEFEELANPSTGPVVPAIRQMRIDVVAEMDQLRSDVTGRGRRLKEGFHGQIVEMNTLIVPEMNTVTANLTAPISEASTDAQTSMTEMKDAIAGPTGILKTFGVDVGDDTQDIVTDVIGKWDAIQGVLGTELDTGPWETFKTFVLGILDQLRGGAKSVIDAISGGGSFPGGGGVPSSGFPSGGGGGFGSIAGGLVSGVVGGGISAVATVFGIRSQKQGDQAIVNQLAINHEALVTTLDNLLRPLTKLLQDIGLELLKLRVDIGFNSLVALQKIATTTVGILESIAVPPSIVVNVDARGSGDPAAVGAAAEAGTMAVIDRGLGQTYRHGSRVSGGAISV